MPPSDVVEIPSVLIQLRLHFLQLQRAIDIHMYILMGNVSAAVGLASENDIANGNARMPCQREAL